MTVRVPATARSRRTRARLAGASRDALAAGGTLDAEAVAGAAGVSTATFYAHFGTHDEAVAAALDLTLARIVGVAERRFHIEALLEEGLETVIRRVVHESYAVFRAESGVLRAALARASIREPLREVYRSHESRSLAHLSRHIRLGQKAGLLRKGPPEGRAVSMLVLIQSLHNPLLTKRRLDPGVAKDMERSLLAVLGPESSSV